MSGLREAISATIREHVFGNDTPADEAECCADAVLRVLAEHGDTEQVREQVSWAIHQDCTHEMGAPCPCPDQVDRVWAVVARIVAARDAARAQAQEILNEAKRLANINAEQAKQAVVDQVRIEHVETDLAAARQQLEQVREEIAQAIIRDASSRPQSAEPFRRGMFTAADIAREYAKEPQEEGR